MNVSTILSIGGLKVAESCIAIGTRLLQLFMLFLISQMIVLLISTFAVNNLRFNRVTCGTYVLDSSHAWLEVNSRNGDRVLTVTYDCGTNAIVNVR